MSIEVGELAALLTLRDQMSDQLKDAAKETGAFEAVFEGSMGTVMGLAGLAVAAIGAVTATIVALGVHGSEVDDIRKAFVNFSGGPDQAAESLNAMRTATRGTVSDLDLTRDAMGLLRVGAQLSAEDFGTLAQAAFVLGHQGGNTKDILDELSGALETGRTRTVARMLGTVNATSAEQDYATTLDVSKDALTESGKVEAKRLEIMSMLRDAVRDAGDIEMTFADRVNQSKANVKNFTDELSVAVSTSPVVKAAMDFIGDALQEAFGDNQVQTIQTLIGYVNDFVIALVGMAQTGISVAKFINDAFYGSRQMFANFLGTVLDLASGLIGLVNTAAVIAEKIPGVGDNFKGAADATKDWKTWIDGARQGLTDYGNEAIDTAGKHDAALSEMNATLETLKQKLVEAQAAGTDTTQIVNALGAAHKQAAQAVSEWTKVLDAAVKKNAEVNAEYDSAVAHGLSYIKIMDLMGSGIQELIKNHDLLGTKLPATWGVAIELLTRVTDAQDKERDAVKAALDDVDKHVADSSKMQIAGYMAGILAAGQWHDEVVADELDASQKGIVAIELRRDTEILSLKALQATNADVYAEIVAQIQASADQAIVIAVGANKTQAEQLHALGALTKDELQGIADNAKNTYDAMVDDSESFTEDEIEHFRRIAVAAQQAADGTQVEWQRTFQALDLGSAVFQQIGGKIGAMGTIAVDTFKNVAGALEKGDWFGAIIAGAVGAVKAIGTLFGAVSQLEQAGRSTEATFEKSFGSFDDMMAAIGKAYAAQGLSAQQAQTDVLAMMAAEKQGGDAVTAAIAKINDVINDQTQDASDLNAAIQKYGFSIAELGPTMQKQQLTAQAVALENDFRLLAGSGIDVNTVLEHMGGSINDFLHLAQQTGSEVPSEMQPILQKMIDNKELVDANGVAYTDLSQTGVTFSETMTQGFQKVVDKLTELIDKIAGTTGALNAIPKTVDVSVNMNGQWNIPDMPTPDLSDVPGHALGGVFATEHLARIAEAGKPEIVGDQDFMTAALQKALVSVDVSTPSSSTSSDSSAHFDRLVASMEGIRDDLSMLPDLLSRSVKSVAMLNK